MTPITAYQTQHQPVPRFGMAVFRVEPDADGQFRVKTPKKHGWFYRGKYLYLVNDNHKSKRELVGDRTWLYQATAAWNAARKTPDIPQKDLQLAYTSLNIVHETLAAKARPWPVSA